MQAIADWLKNLGMSEYAQRFAENDIDLSVLPDLTDQDLRELGLSMGHRRRLLRAISELNNTPASTIAAVKSTAPPISVSESSPSGAAATVASVGETVGERRHITVMFCDLWIQLELLHDSTPRNGAISSALIWMPLRQQSQRWAAKSPRSWATD